MNEIFDKLNNQWIPEYIPKSWIGEVATEVQLCHCRHVIVKLRTTKSSPTNKILKLP